MNVGWLKWVAQGVGIAALALVIAASPAAAQRDRDACRCVDTDGNEIENCSCFRAPNMEALFTSFGLRSSRPRLGISVDVSQRARRDAQGAYVTDVLEGGPADDAGIRDGDVITAIDGQSLFESLGAEAEDAFDLDESFPVQRLLAIARELEPGQEVEVEYLRGDDLQTTMLEAEDLSRTWGRSSLSFGWDAERFGEQMRVLTDGLRFRTSEFDRLEPLQDRYRGLLFELESPRVGDFRVRGDAPRGLERFGRSRNGLELLELNPGLGAYFGVDGGVLVVDVERGSGLGLEAGDVVLRIGERSVETPARFRRVIESYGDEEDITFHIRRDGSETTVIGRIRY